MSHASRQETFFETCDPVWHKSAPKAVRNAYAEGGPSAGWTAWRQHLRDRTRPIEPSLPWGNQDIWLGVADSDLADGMAEAAMAWLRHSAGDSIVLDDAMAALAWCRRLPMLAETLASDDWWNLLNHLRRLADEAAAVTSQDRSENAALVWQLLAGELPLTLACLFPELTACRKLLPKARLALSAGLADLLDGKGLPHATCFGQLRPLLACWTRCRGLADRLKRKCWIADAERQYAYLVRNALRLCRRDGSLVFGDRSVDQADVKLLETAARLCGDKKNRVLASQTLARAGAAKKSHACDKRGPKAAVHSEWASVALLRPDWSPSSPRLTALFPGDACRIELACGRDVLWSGDWSMDIQIDGVDAVPTSDWSELCWLSDKDVDYLELEIDLGEGLRVQRHFVLGRKDRILLLADTVLASRPATIAYRGTLPLCSNVAFRETCDSPRAVLATTKPRVMVLPLALPEHRSEDTTEATAASNAFVADGRGLQLQQTIQGRSLFAPMFFDLNPRRFLRANGDRNPSPERLVWRQLTVGERWAVQPADVAVGYRVAIGMRQWLIYRSLTHPGNRTLLGHNISSEMLVARFDRKGEVQSLIEIEA